MKFHTIAALAMGFVAAAQAGTVFTLDPVGGSMSGAPGDVEGWGFTFFNDSGFALITSSMYLTGTPLGTYRDLVSLQFHIVGPAPERTNWNQFFDATAGTGAGEYLIDGFASVGAHSDGTVQMTYDLYRVSPNDPNFDPGNDLVSSGNTISAIASIDVIAATVMVVPEPGYTVMAALALTTFARKRRKAIETGY